MNSIAQAIGEYGATEAGILSFDDGDAPELLAYSTLIAARLDDRSPFHQDLAALRGVYEWQERPLVFLVDGDALTDDDHLRRIRRLLALNGDTPYLGVVQPGRLVIHRVTLDNLPPNKSRISLPTRREEKSAIFPWLANMRPGIDWSRQNWISDVVLQLLRNSIGELRRTVSPEDAISLAGRALFVRFLADRSLLPQSLLAACGGEASALFDEPTRAEAVSRWLDTTFNGDLLPLEPGRFHELPNQALRTLAHIQRKAPGGQLHLGWEQKWDYLDFAHIPVGVLSQAYEQYMREHQPAKQRKEGSYYTPRPIAELMVRAAFAGLRDDGKAHCARILDPAVGAGVFLLSAFRQLVAERWRQDGSRPNTRTLRDILYQQLVGFDTNEEALRFAALGLYLISIELDPHPEPVEKLRFAHDLRGTVLYRMGENPSAEVAAVERGLGSLGDAVGAAHVQRYDLVIGNPPWTTGTKLPKWGKVKDNIGRIARDRLATDVTSSLLPNECLDLPFVWRSMEWARAGGQIALALHARVLFQQGDGMPEARKALFNALDVTGVLNGAELRQSNVWPGISAPFCLLFAKNRVPPPGAAFRFVSPHLETSLNRAGVMRVDAANAEIVSGAQIAERPQLLKTLFRGSQLDLEVLGRTTSRGMLTLEEYWANLFGRKRGRPKQAANGYQRLRDSTEKAQPANGLLGLPHLAWEGKLPLLVEGERLPIFAEEYLHRTRSRDTYRGPLLIVHQSPPVRAGRVRVAVADGDVVFSESYYGYSAYGHPEASRLTKYLALLVGSRPAYWYVLMSSGKFGFERDVVEKSTVDTIPVVPYEDLNEENRVQIDRLFDSLVKDDSERQWAKVDAWAASLFGLRRRDLQVIDDTLRYNLPFADNRIAAQALPTAGAIESFGEALASELRPWAQRDGLDVQVVPSPVFGSSPWAALLIRATRSEGRFEPSLPNLDWQSILSTADALGTTEVMVPDEVSGGLWIARLRQARYWSASQARLVARRIVWEHLDALFGRGAG